MTMLLSEQSLHWVDVEVNGTLSLVPKQVVTGTLL
jgi:hypothetical protein